MRTAEGVWLHAGPQDLLTSAKVTTCCQFDSTLRTFMIPRMTQAESFTAKPAVRRRDTLTDLVIDVFRLNGALLASGDALVADLGLTSARWQVLGAIAFASVPLPVAHIARNMGLTRQAVQRSVDDMRADGLVRLDPNPHHRRAMLISMTDLGEAAYQAASQRQRSWAEALAAGLPPENIEAARDLLRLLQRRLDNPAASAPTAQ
ncbi:DNA-binding transcriptional regulator, MarR family [Methylobacterium pseudosasicola]|uniref:DNA-binding transcriptional regulator, MarR family n=2 Tax=Methylobacterium pseudosasicola TaxID=582667 RepID=A0A1I4FHE5_9HYPH|nr:DNA-binding transcriptional regulator, MarR family [Methylobacterium pseudosasicola]